MLVPVFFGKETGAGLAPSFTEISGNRTAAVIAKKRSVMLDFTSVKTHAGKPPLRVPPKG
jgi:hypothetical protein